MKSGVAMRFLVVRQEASTVRRWEVCVSALPFVLVLIFFFIARQKLDIRRITAMDLPLI